MKNKNFRNQFDYLCNPDKKRWNLKKNGNVHSMDDNICKIDMTVMKQIYKKSGNNDVLPEAI